MKRVTGIGGIFFKGKDPKELRAWYKKHLGFDSDPDDGHEFKWLEAHDPDVEGSTTWSVFDKDTDYFEPSKSPFMINYRVDDLHALLDQLRKEGVWVDEKVEEKEYGKFGWIMDPDGNRIELWEPAEE